MRVRWILTREAATDIERLLGRRVPLAELRPRHPIGGTRPVWRLGRALQRLLMTTVERRVVEDGRAVLVREIVEVLPPHEGWPGPGRGRARPSRNHRDIAHAAQTAGVYVSPADVRDMPIGDRRRFAQRVGWKMG